MTFKLLGSSVIVAVEFLNGGIVCKILIQLQKNFKPIVYHFQMDFCLLVGY